MVPHIIYNSRLTPIIDIFLFVLYFSNAGERAIIRDYWDVHPLNTDYMKIFEDPKTGSYTTKKMFVDDDDLVVKLSSIQVLL